MKQTNDNIDRWEIFRPYFKQQKVPARKVLLHEGYVLTCVGYAHSDDVVVEFD